MTVSSTANKIIYSGNAATTSFPFSFSTDGKAADVQVFFTDVNGNVTTLVNGPGSSQYQISFNPVTGTNPTPAGGTVVYNPLGTPIPSGTLLTILRNLPLTQTTSLANQGTLYQTVTEQALDYEMMVSQQVLEAQSRALVVAVSDPTPSTIPSVAARKGLVLGFDSNGNPIAVSGLSAGVVSSAMQPVVNAATLAAGRTAFGLGTVAVENIGGGLQDDGAGNLRTFYNHVTDSTSQSVIASFHQNVRLATTSTTYTLPLSSTLFNGFGFFIEALGGDVTLAPNAADAFSGVATGTSIVIPSGSRAFVSTGAAGTWYIFAGNVNAGFNAPSNIQINATVAGSALTIALKDRNGLDPSSASPILYTVSAGGNTVQRAITGPLSITVPSGGTLGTGNGIPNRIWIGVFDTPGGPVLGVYNSLSIASAQIIPWDETGQPATTAVSAGSTSSQTWYTQGSSLSSRAFRIFGYVESTQPTAGTWSVTPSKVQLFGPGVRKPGDVVKCQNNSSSISVSYGLQNSANVVAIDGNLAWTMTAASITTVVPTLFRGATAISSVSFQENGLNYSAAYAGATTLSAYDSPGSSPITYSIGLGSGTSGNVSTTGGNLKFTELFI